MTITLYALISGDFTEALLSVINSVGFPIACVIACGWFIYMITEQNREDSKVREEKQRKDNKDREDRLYNEIGKFGATLDKFNDTLSSIDKRLAILESKIDNK